MKIVHSCLCGAIGAVAMFVLVQPTMGQPLHLWCFDGPLGQTLTDSGTGGIDLNITPGQGSVGGSFGRGRDLVFEPGFNNFGRAYRPYYVDASISSAAGVGLTGNGFTSPNQFTIETLVKADQKTTGSGVNYIFQTRPGIDRGYYLIQDEDNVSGGATSGLGSIIGTSFVDAEVPASHSDDGHWFYIAATIDLTSNAGQAVADVFIADVTAGGPLTQVANNRSWGTTNPSSLAGATGVIGIGGFAIDRDRDGLAEASSEWFQGAIDYLAIYDGLLSRSELEKNLSDRLNTRRDPDGKVRGPLAPEPASVALLSLFGLIARGSRHRDRKPGARKEEQEQRRSARQRVSL